MIINETTANIFKRQTIRDYTPEQISDEMLETLMHAAKMAPSGRNVQPCLVRFVNTARNRLCRGCAAKGRKKKPPGPNREAPLSRQTFSLPQVICKY